MPSRKPKPAVLPGVGDHRGHIAIPLGLASIGSFPDADNGDEARLLWSMLALTTYGRVDYDEDGGSFFVVVYRWQLEQASGRDFHAKRGSTILERACERSRVSAPGTRMDGVRLFERVAMAVQAGRDRSAMAIYLTPGHARYIDTVSKARAEVPIAVWHALGRTPAVEMAVRAAACFADTTKGVWRLRISGEDLRGMAPGRYCAVHLKAAIEQLEEVPGWVKWSVHRSSRGSGAVTVIASRRFGLTYQLKPGLTPRLRPEDIVAERTLRNAAIAAEMAEGVQRQADDVEARNAPPIPVAANDDKWIEEARHRRREGEAMAAAGDPFKF
jgi:hypothetical protein